MQVYRATILSFAAMLLLSGCDAVMRSPTHVTTDRAEVYRDQFALDTDTISLQGGKVTEISRHYINEGDGPLYIQHSDEGSSGIAASGWSSS